VARISAMRGSIDQLGSWANAELKYWERAALAKIAGAGELTENDINELLQYFLEDAGLVPIPSRRPPLSLLDGEAAESDIRPCRLNRISDLRNVNALPNGQEIRFGPQLTVVYGNNGAGKSGYARALGAACFARGDRRVLPNAAGTDSRQVPQAAIEFSHSDKVKQVVWFEGQRCPDLSGFYFFDSGSLKAHLTRSNPLSFTPAGLSLLSSLAELTDLVRAKVRDRIEACEKPQDFLPFFEGDSEVRRLLSNLCAETDLGKIDEAAQVTTNEPAQITLLEEKIAELRLLNVSKQVEKRKQETSDLEGLISSIGAARNDLGGLVETEIANLLDRMRACRDEVERSGVNQFKFPGFTQVGSEAWRQFVTASKKLADAEKAVTGSYPEVGDHCLLCQQVLASEHVALLGRMWAFLSSNAQGELTKAEAAIAAKLLTLQNLRFGHFGLGSSVRRLLEEELPVAVPAIVAHVESCVDRCSDMQNALKTGEIRRFAPLVDFDVTELRKLVQVRQEDVRQLEKSDSAERLSAAEAMLRQLRHRSILATHLQSIKNYVENLKWAKKAQQALGSTRAITVKYGALFEELVTDRYKSLFEDTLKRFSQEIKVQIDTKGSKGETVKSLVLSPESFRPGFGVDQVLSEGQQRAVAIADFLTEAALDQKNNGVILDDPVTSLDDNWKQTLAACLAELAKSRQVIIFTHDLAFLYRLKERARELSVDVAAHWIREEGGKPGFVYLNNSPLCEKDYKSAEIARDYYRRSKDAPPAERDSLLQMGFGALRSSYEALVIFDIFSSVVGRFEERLHFESLKNVRIDPKLVDEIVARMGTLSEHINAHLHSDKFRPVKPSPETLLAEIEAFEFIRKTQKSLNKAPVAKGSPSQMRLGLCETEKSSPSLSQKSIHEASKSSPD
jgi:recombinational DNA repair ATPase RecF